MSILAINFHSLICKSVDLNQFYLTKNHCIRLLVLVSSFSSEIWMCKLVYSWSMLAWCQGSNDSLSQQAIWDLWIGWRGAQSVLRGSYIQIDCLLINIFQSISHSTSHDRQFSCSVFTIKFQSINRSAAYVQLAPQEWQHARLTYTQVHWYAGISANTSWGTKQYSIINRFCIMILGIF